MNELLSPAGTLEAFHAAISNGADAIYLGLDKFNARAYANNFTIENLKELLKFAHLRNVKIYVTMNTIVYDYELEEVYKTIDELAAIGVDGIIVQDLAILNYITSHYKSLHAHASTQMGIDDLDGATLAKEMGINRVVFARETNLETLKNIKEQLGIEIEAFVHGALCVSYSGNCLMSSSIGERSGNRGRCAGCCRKLYTLVNTDSNVNEKTGYLLSMKDLNTSDYINNMKFIDSYKVEGRMKEPNYVASVTNYYRHLMDHEPVNKDSLLKVFNRTYTKGHINGDKIENLTNIEKPNNYGYLIGEITKANKGKIWIKLNKELNKGDQIRVETQNLLEEISLPVTRIFDANMNVITTTNKLAIIDCEKRVMIGAKVYKTKDINFVEEADRTLLKKEYKKLDVDMEFTAELGKPLFLKVTYQNYKAFAKSEILIEEAKSSATTRENVENQLAKLNDTPYKIKNLVINMDDNLFIPLKAINELRREAIEKLNNQRLERKVVTKEAQEIVPMKHDLIDPEITVSVMNEDQYEAAKEAGIKHIYYKNIVRRNNAQYKDYEGEVLVGGLGGIHHYKNKNIIVSDTSLNVVNCDSAAILSSLGVERVTISEEISQENIKALIKDYVNKYKTNPNLELIVYGRTKIMHTKYCPLRRLGMCGKCKESHFALKDDFASFPLVFNDDCTITLLNSKVTNIMDEIDGLKGINYYRLSFTTESKEEISRIIKAFQNRLAFGDKTETFDRNEHTRGHFFKNPL